jgi:hypothetical protein
MPCAGALAAAKRAGRDDSPAAAVTLAHAWAAAGDAGNARDPELLGTHRQLLAPALGHDQLPAPVRPSHLAAIPVIEPLTERSGRCCGMCRA